MIESPVRGLSAVLAAGVAGLLGTDLSAVPPRELAELMTDLEKHRRQLEAVEVGLISALAAQVSPAEFGATSVPDLVGGLTRVTRAEARARVQRSVDLAPRRTLTGEPMAPIHPGTAAALSGGEISGAHADVVVHYLGRIPAPIAYEVFGAAEEFLVEAARHEDPATLRRSGDLLLARLDQDGKQPTEDQQDRQRHYAIGGRRGSNAVTGEFTDETTAVWRTILDALAAPRPAADGTRDERSAGQRNHDAMLEAGLRLLRSGTLPDCGGVPASVIVRVDADDLDPTRSRRGDSSDGASSDGASSDGASSHAVSSDAVSSDAAWGGAVTGNAESGGGAPGRRRGVAQTAHGDIVGVDRLLRLAGEAEITTVVLSAGGEILDYGRTQRYASCGQRRALTARDGGCCFPGCSRPAAWCEAHHIRAWIDGGETNLDNLCLLCAYHHRTFEKAGWAVAMTDGVPQWTPPAWLDAHRRPRRNTAHHLPEIDFALCGQIG